MTARERDLVKRVKNLERENRLLRKYERWYIVGEIRVRRALKQREKARG